MLYIDTQQRNYAWHVGEPLKEIAPETVVRVQADCDELAWVLAEFGPTMPCHRGPVNNWFGDTAKIVARIMQVAAKPAEDIF